VIVVAKRHETNGNNEFLQLHHGLEADVPAVILVVRQLDDNVVNTPVSPKSS
jgi:hypothetical protein